MKELSLRTSA